MISDGDAISRLRALVCLFMVVGPLIAVYIFLPMSEVYLMWELIHCLAADELLFKQLA